MAWNGVTTFVDSTQDAADIMEPLQAAARSLETARRSDSDDALTIAFGELRPVPCRELLAAARGVALPLDDLLPRVEHLDAPLVPSDFVESPTLLAPMLRIEMRSPS